MKITLEKNLVFGDQPKPILARDVAKLVKPIPAKKPLKHVQLDISMLLPTEGKPKIECLVDEKQRAVVKVGNFKLGQHVVPPAVEAKGDTKPRCQMRDL